MSHVGAFSSRPDCAVTTICDADEAVVGPAMKMAERAGTKSPKFQQDVRKVLEDKSIDVVSIATPNHWHALIAIWAIQAGKDVYVEKPVSHNVSEGRRIVEAARKHRRICQTGTQCRSSTGMRQAIDFLHQGKLGKVKVARGLCYKPRGSIGKVKMDQPIPKSVNYDLWTGPAPLKPLHRKSLHYDWHWLWDYGNGDLGNQGIHQMDIARWGLGKNELATEVISVGGRFGYVDDGETANTQICVFRFGDDAELIFEVQGLRAQPLRGAMVGNIFHCEKGTLVLPGYESGLAYDLDGQEIQKFRGGGDHFDNFIKAVRSRRAEDLYADILEGHLSSALCHLGNISYRLGKPQRFSQNKAFGDDKEGERTFARMEEHLLANQLKLAEMSYRLGARLVLDPEREIILNRDDAKPFLTREYRKGFVVPEKV
jgi:predicted dehydrogenase